MFYIFTQSESKYVSCRQRGATEVLASALPVHWKSCVPLHSLRLNHRTRIGHDYQELSTHTTTKSQLLASPKLIHCAQCTSNVHRSPQQHTLATHVHMTNTCTLCNDGVGHCFPDALTALTAHFAYWTECRHGHVDDSCKSTTVGHREDDFGAQSNKSTTLQRCDFSCRPIILQLPQR